MYNVFEICAEGIFVTFPWWLENVKSRSKIALFFFFFQMSAILTFDFQKENNYVFLACGNYIFPKTRGNKNKPWTHSTSLKVLFVTPRTSLKPPVVIRVASWECMTMLNKMVCFLLIVSNDVLIIDMLFKLCNPKSISQPVTQRKAYRVKVIVFWLGFYVIMKCLKKCQKANYICWLNKKHIILIYSVSCFCPITHSTREKNVSHSHTLF